MTDHEIPETAADVIAMVDERLEKIRNDRRNWEAQWILNANFYAGHQYCDIHPVGLEVHEIAPTRKNIERAVFNKITPLMQTRLANLEMVDYAMTVQPRTNELDDIEKSEIATGLLRYAQQLGDFNVIKSTMIQWAELTGTAFVLSWWDTQKGEELMQGLYEGDLNYGLLTPYEVFPADLYEQEIKDQRYVILDQALNIDDVYDIYGVETNGEDIETYVLTPIYGSQEYGHWITSFSYGRKQVNDAVHVKTYFEAKSRRYPDGRMAIVIGDHLCYYGKLPYNEIPLVAMKSQIVPGQFFGKSVIQDLIPLQRAYNGYMNRIHSHLATSTSNLLLIPENGGIDREDLETAAWDDGRVIFYRDGTQRPSYLEPQGLTQQVFAHKDKLVNDMEYAAGVSQLMVTGATPAGVTSGTAIDNLKQIDSTRMSLTAENIRGSVLGLAKIWLDIYKRYSMGYRAVRVVGNNNIGAALTWSRDELNSYEIKYEAENELIFNREARKEAFLAALNLGLYTDQNGQIPESIKQYGIELFNVGNFGSTSNEIELQRQNAQRENSFLVTGTVPVMRDYIDDHQIHIQEHRVYMLQLDFYKFEKRMPTLAGAFKNHVEEHKNILVQQLKGIEENGRDQG